MGNNRRRAIRVVLADEPGQLRVTCADCGHAGPTLPVALLDVLHASARRHPNLCAAAAP